MRSFLLLVAAALATGAAPVSYDAVCSAPCSASDGTTQPAGTVLARPIWDGVTPYLPTDAAGNPLALIPTGSPPTAVYQPQAPVVIPTTIDPLGFMGRLTAAEQVSITTAGQSNAQVMLFLLKLAGAQQVDVTDPLTIGGMQAMVGAGLLTAPRAGQILNLAVTSP